MHLQCMFNTRTFVTHLLNILCLSGSPESTCQPQTPPVIPTLHHHSQTQQTQQHSCDSPSNRKCRTMSLLITKAQLRMGVHRSQRRLTQTGAAA